MDSKTNKDGAALRCRAERGSRKKSELPLPHTEADARRLVHELEVHQIELEMQNLELRQARDGAEAILEKYTDLYDFAPADFELTGSNSHRRVVNIEAQRSPHGLECNAVMVDITERKRAQEIAHRSEILFSALVSQAPTGVYVVDSAFRLQQANPIAMRIFENVFPLIGRDFSEVIRKVWPRRIADQIVGSFRRTLELGESFQSPLFAERRRDTGLKEDYEWQIQRVVLPAGEYGVVCFFTDITPRVRAEAAPRRVDALAGTARTALFRIVQEALTNVSRHAKASRAEVTIECHDDRVFMEIRDDGQGFNTKAKKHNRLGLVGMRERVEMLGGTFRLESVVGEFTTVIVEIPIAKRAGRRRG